MFWTIAAFILIPAIRQGVAQARREDAAKAAAACAAAERAAFFASHGITHVPGTELSPDVIREPSRQGLLTWR